MNTVTKILKNTVRIGNIWQIYNLDFLSHLGQLLFLCDSCPAAQLGLADSCSCLRRPDTAAALLGLVDSCSCFRRPDTAAVSLGLAQGSYILLSMRQPGSHPSLDLAIREFI